MTDWAALLPIHLFPLDSRCAYSRAVLTDGPNDAKSRDGFESGLTVGFQHDIAEECARNARSKALTRLVASWPVVLLRGTSVAHVNRKRCARATRMVTPTSPSLAGNS